VKRREIQWAAWMRAARAGDAMAYDRCLRDMARALRPFVRRGLARAGHGDDNTEDVVQEILLAVHLKQHSWDETRPIGPWVAAIARYKLVDALRRRGSGVHLPIDDFAEILPADERPADFARDVARSLDALPARQRDVLQSIAVEGATIGETAARLGVSEGAVRVALHRGLATLAKRAEKP
jgi:RNA polymerase sigma-70 factor (ECF subfamily)